MNQVALAIAYDGTRFDSYARQPGRRTVEGELVRLLEQAGFVTGEDGARLRSGSRTDRGVSAAWNVVSLDTDAAPGRLVAATALAPEGLHLLSAIRVDPAFEPRRARRRVYRYILDRPWDWTKVRDAARFFEGDHDFTNFRKADEGVSPTATLDRVRYRARPPGPWLEFTARSFLWHQVRRIVSALEGVEAGRRSAQEVRRALDEPRRRVDWGLAPPEPLLLARVDYADLEFPPSPRVALARLERDVRLAGLRARFLGAARGNLPTTRR